MVSLFYALLLLLLICFLLAILFFYIFLLIGLLTTNAPFVPIPRSAIEKIVGNLKLTETSVLYDLGCGDGRVLRMAADLCPEIRAVGVEKAMIPYLLARFNTRKYRNIEIRRENFFRTDISDATHIYMYLFPAVTTKLLQKIKRECRPGTRVVSCDFKSEVDVPNERIDLGRKKRELGRALFIYVT